MKILSSRLIILLITGFLLSNATMAGLFTDESLLTSGAITESFEGLSPGPNIPRVDIAPDGGDLDPLLRPASDSAFTFLSGITMVGPVTNDPVAINSNMPQVMIGDYKLGEADFRLLENGRVDSAADVPSGTAYMGLNIPAPTGEVTVKFDLLNNMLRVGAFVTSSLTRASNPQPDIKINVYDAAGTRLNQLGELNHIDAVHVSQWRSNFLGWYDPLRRIRFVEFTGRFMVLDNLAFVPQPPTLFLMGLGLMVLYCFSKYSFRRDWLSRHKSYKWV